LGAIAGDLTSVDLLWGLELKPCIAAKTCRDMFVNTPIDGRYQNVVPVFCMLRVNPSISAKREVSPAYWRANPS
jgi:hypothetical protein